MNTLKPIIIGITGHRQLREEDIPQLKKAVKDQLLSVLLRCPNSPVKLLTCLAEGADQLCAEVAQELNIGIIAALPMEVSEYEKDFQSGALFNFRNLLSKAENVFVVPKIEKEENSRAYFYRQADIYIANHSHAVIALWDSSAAKNGGCGTAETVDMVLNHSYQGKRKVAYDDGFVIHINTPRKEEGIPGEVKYLGNEALFYESIEKLDELNKEGGDPDKLSVANGKKYHKSLIGLAALGTILTMAFLLYDEVMLKWMLLVLGFVLVIMWLVFKLAGRSKCHEKYVEYRSFAECIRVQKHLNKSGFRIDVADYLDWTRRFDTAWIHKAMQAITVTETVEKVEDIKNDWLYDQQKYHERAAEKTQRLSKRNNIILSSSLILSVAIYIFALIFEYIFDANIGANPELIRTIIKVAIGTASAGSLFAASYYGKLSLKRVYEDHVRMANYFKCAIRHLDSQDLDEEFLEELITEELSENSNWCSYEKDNEIDLII